MPLGPEDITLTGKTLTGGAISGSSFSGNITASTFAGTIGNSTISGTLSNGTVSSVNITASTYAGNIASGTTITAAQVKGTSTLPLAQRTSSALLTTPVAGGMEFDGVSYYDSDGLARRHARMTAQVATLTTSYVLTDSTVIQKLTNASTNGAVNVGPNQSYLFECGFNATVLSTAAGSYGFSFAGTANISEQNWWVTCARSAASSAPATATISHHSAASTACFGVSATTHLLLQLAAQIKGKLVITTSGTVIPSIFLGSSSATGTPQIDRGAYFVLWPVGSNTVNTVGAWT